MSEENIKNVDETTKNNPESSKSEIFDWVQNITVILVAIVLIFIFCARIVGVDGQSMMPTLEHKDWLITSNLFYEPEQGDIVVLAKKSFLDGKMIVKRVIAVEGQTVDIDFQKGIVYVDGEALDEPYIYEKTYRMSDAQFPQTVPKDCVFVLGDNRNHSSDSREASLGMVNKANILGKVVFRVLPFESFGTVD